MMVKSIKMLNIKAHCKMQDIRRLSLGLILIICSASSFSQSSFGFREMASDSVLIADDVCDICIGSILFNRRFEIIEHTVDSIGDGRVDEKDFIEWWTVEGVLLLFLLGS